MNHALYQRQGSNTFHDEKPFYSDYMANSTLWENYIFVSTWTASKVFDRIILHNFRYCVQQQVGMTKILTNFSIRVLQLIRKNLNLFHRPEKHLSHMIGMLLLCIKRSLGKTCAFADSTLLSTFYMLAAAVKSQLFSII